MGKENWKTAGETVGNSAYFGIGSQNFGVFSMGVVRDAFHVLGSGFRILLNVCMGMVLS